MKVLAIIPARKGSKGIPGKNIYPILGKPLIEYTIEAALSSNLLKKIIISSDDPRIKQIAESFDQIQFHQRPIKYADDTSLISKTIEHILATVSKNEVFDAIMLLQPTSPIRTGKQIDEAINLIKENPDANSLISVCGMEEIHPARMYWSKDSKITPMIEDIEHSRRQDLPKAFFRNGSIYITRLSAFIKENKVMAKPSIGYIMPYSQLLNIDDQRDLIIAEPLISAWQKGLLQ